MTVSLVAFVLVAVGALVATVATHTTPQLGLDLQGGASVVLQPRNKVPSEVLDQAIEIIRSRVDALGVAEPDIARQGDTIIVQLPGIKDTERALQIVGQTAQLEFRPVVSAVPLKPEPREAKAPCADSPVPPTEGQAVLPEERGGKIVGCYLVGPADVKGQAISAARAKVEPTTSAWKIEFDLTGQGETDWNAMATKAGVGTSIAIDLDGVVKSAPRLNSTDFKGSGEISGSFTESEAKDLALVLRYGSLPVQLDRQTVQTVSASLGKDSLHAGILAGMVGLGLVALYMLVYYRALGVVVWIGLVLSAAVLYSIVSFLGRTSGLALTLAGATGIIVSVGVTVDSYVVYFERLKDEIRAGRTIRSSVDRGFSRAYRTILAADAVSFIGAVVLYLLSVGSVRGFAFFLALSTLLDVIVAYMFTRPMVVLLGRNRTFTEAKWLGVARGLAAPAETAGAAGAVPAPAGGGA